MELYVLINAGAIVTGLNVCHRRVVEGNTELLYFTDIEKLRVSYQVCIDIR